MKLASACAAIAFAVGTTGLAANYTEAALLQSTFGDSPSPFYEGEFGVRLDSTEVTSVTIAKAGVGTLPLTQESDGWWIEFMDPQFANVRTAMNGTWDLQVSVGATVIGQMTFVLSVPDMLAEEVFPKLPTIASPLHGAMIAEGSPITATWTHPSTDPLENPVDFRSAELDNDATPGVQYPFAASTTSWSMGSLPQGQYQLEVLYANAAPEAELEDMLQVTQSTAGFWSTSPMAPAYWPSGSPFLASVSSHEIEFAVVPEPTSLTILAAASLLLPMRRCRRH